MIKELTERSYLKILIDYFGTDVKRINHAVKVATFARYIALLEEVSEKDLMVIEICGYLHDVGIKLAEERYQSSNGKYQEELGPEIVKELLKEYAINETSLNRICYIIGNHHTYSKIDAIDFQILVEADFIVNIYEDNMNKESIKEVYRRIFKTKTGKEFIENMYL